jgi:ABC-type antimicrobial peptide transport system permease subunit
MRKLAVAGLTVVVAAVVAATALASAFAPTVTVKAGLNNSKTGTRSHPQPVRLTATFHWQDLGAANQPIVQRFKVLFPQGSFYNGAKVPSCSFHTLNAVGPHGCPKGSIMGFGTGNAFADTVITHPKITVVNGGANTVFFYTVLNNPARVQTPVVGHISRITGKYAYELRVTVPQVLQVVAGVPIELTFLTVNAGQGSWLETTGCPSNGRWPFKVTTSYSTGGSASDTSSVPCHH